MFKLNTKANTQVNQRIVPTSTAKSADRLKRTFRRNSLVLKRRLLSSEMISQIKKSKEKLVRLTS